MQQAEDVPEPQSGAPLILQQDPGLVELVAHHPVSHRLHVAAVDGGGVEHGSLQSIRSSMDANGAADAFGRATNLIGRHPGRCTRRSSLAL